MLVIQELKHNYNLNDLYLHMYKDYSDKTLMLVRVKKNHSTSKWMEPNLHHLFNDYNLSQTNLYKISETRTNLNLRVIYSSNSRHLSPVAYIPFIYNNLKVNCCNDI